MTARLAAYQVADLAAPRGTSLAIAIRVGGGEGAGGRDRTLRLPVIRLRPRTFANIAPNPAGSVLARSANDINSVRQAEPKAPVHGNSPVRGIVGSDAAAKA